MAESAAVGLVGGLAGPLAMAIVGAASAARIGITVTFVDGRAPSLVYVNAAFADMLGYTSEELLARSPLENVPPDQLPRVNERYAKRMQGDQQEIRYELDMLHKHGRRVPVAVTATAVALDDRRAVIGFVVDVSARKHAEDVARKSEASFRELIEAAPEAFAIWRGVTCVYANAAYVEILGYASAEALMQVPMTQLVHPDDAAVLALRSRRLGDGDRLPPQTYRLFRHDGTIALLEISSVRFEYQGEPAILSIGRNVTERRRLESQLVQADRLAALGTLAAGVAHEVNNPLAYLSLNLEWLARHLPSLAHDPSRLEELCGMLDEARHGVERVGAIVRELRTFSRADGETRRAVDLATAVTTAIKIASHEIRHRAKVVTEFDDVPPVWANEARVEQVLLNLLLNAAQAIPEKDAERNVIRVVVRAGDRGRAIVEVIDNGVGIPPESIRRIFDPFFTTKPVGVGTGLGLSICHSIVTSLGGQISVASVVGEGTTFRIVLPTNRIPDSEPPPSLEPTSIELRTLPRARVLVIDDEIAIANTLRELLQTDHDVVAASSGRAALALITRGDEFDVIFCDLMMPEMSGMDLYETLARERAGVEERIVFMTGGAFTPRAAEFLARVNNRRLEKPFSLSAVEHVVRDAMKASGLAGTAGRVA